MRFPSISCIHRMLEVKNTRPRTTPSSIRAAMDNVDSMHVLIEALSLVVLQSWTSTTILISVWNVNKSASHVHLVINSQQKSRRINS